MLKHQAARHAVDDRLSFRLTRHRGRIGSVSNQTGRIRFLLRLLLCLLLGPAAASPVAASSAPIATPRFSNLIVFGDSLSDNGNVGRFSNGPVWVEWMATALGLELHPARTGGTNYANAGARTHGGSMDVLAQTAAYLSHRGSADPDAFYVVFAGANDLLASPCQARNTSVVRQAAEAMGTAVGRLAEAGAVDILVPNLPDVGRAPVVRAQGADCAESARRLTRMYNAALEEVLAAVEASRRVRLHRLDVFRLAEEVFADPQSAGFHDVTTPCRGEECESALFWDWLHPTTAAHGLLARQALQVLGLKGS
jgi:phospholipase/lecithinase/hemolysin